MTMSAAVSLGGAAERDAQRMFTATMTTTTMMTTTMMTTRAKTAPTTAAAAKTRVARHHRPNQPHAQPLRRRATVTRNTPAGAGDADTASPLGVFRLEYDISKVRRARDALTARDAARGAMRTEV